MGIVLTQAKEGDTTVLDVAGRIDSVTSEVFSTGLMSILDVKPASVLLDFSNLEFLSSAGIRVLMQAAKAARSGGIKLALCSLRSNITQIFVISGIVPIFNIHSDRAAAIASRP